MEAEIEDLSKDVGRFITCLGLNVIVMDILVIGMGSCLFKSTTALVYCPT